MTTLDDITARPAAGSARPILVSALLVRVAVLLVGLFASLTIPPPVAEQRQPELRALAELPNRWDAGWYIGIAARGYRYLGTGDIRWNHLAFFPAYPLALRVVARLTRVPRTPSAWAWIGVGLSLAAFLWACLYVYRLARKMNPESAEWAVAFLATYPFALFFGAVYTEAFFLLGCAATFWHFGEGAQAKAAAWAFVTGLVRPNGFLLSVPLLLWTIAGRGSRAVPRRRTAFAVSIAPLLGNALFSAYLWRLAGDPFVWISAQKGWGRSFLGLTGAASELASSIRQLGLAQFIVLRPYDTLNAAAGVFAILAAAAVWKRCGLPSATFVAVNIIPPVVVGGVPSLGRYTSVLFPLHIWLASAIPARFRWGTVAGMAALQGVLAVLHYTFRPIY